MKIKFLLSCCAVLVLASAAQAAVVEFRSGNSGPSDDPLNEPAAADWSYDYSVRFKPWLNAAEDSAANQPTAQDFEDVRTKNTITPKSHAAQVAPDGTNGWGSLGSARPVFNFVSSHVYGRGSSSLFGIPFEIDHGDDFNNADLEFTYWADNGLGFQEEGVTVLEGLWLGKPGEEVRLVNTAKYTANDPGGDRFAQGTISKNVGPLGEGAINSDGVHWLYMNVTDRGVPAAGILFTGKITTYHAPEPATMLIWSVLGVSVIGIRRWRQRKHQ